MKRRALLALFATLPLAGCGFQLRGSHTIPYRSIYVDAPRESLAARQLASALRSQDVVVAEAAKDADAVLKLTQEKKERRILALSGGGRVREYRLNYTLSYSLSSKDGREIYPPTVIQSYRDFTYDDNQYLAKTSEENFLYHDQVDNAVIQILRRLALPG
jgi:LPS-assembly lipoprotein